MSRFLRSSAQELEAEEVARKIISGLIARVEADKDDIEKLNAFRDFMSRDGYLEGLSDLVSEIVDQRVYTWYTGRELYEENGSDCEGYENDVLEQYVGTCLMKEDDRERKIYEESLSALKIEYCEVKQDSERLAVFMTRVNVGKPASVSDRAVYGCSIAQWHARIEVRSWIINVPVDEQNEEVRQLLIDRKKTIAAAPVSAAAGCVEVSAAAE